MIFPRMASMIWSGLSAAAREGTRRGWLASERLEGAGRVISVGNLQAGGAGKTPLVARIAREAAERGLSACILCRGYGAEWETTGGVIVPETRTPEPGLCGDEAALLHELAPAATIGVGAKRSRQFELARRTRESRSFDIVLLDDGFQHHRLRRDLDIVAVTSATASDRLFRDWAGALDRASLVVWTKGELRPDARGRPLVRIRYRLPDGSQVRPVWLVTGLADGEFAARSVREAGYRVERHVSFPDHARYLAETVQGILAGARAAGCELALTGKDWVKWRALGVRPEQVRVLEPELIFEEGRELWERALWGG